MIIKQMRKSVARKHYKKPAGPLIELDISLMARPPWLTRAYRNNRVTVMIDDNAQLSDGTMAICAMVQRHDDTPIPHHWRSMQAIKDEIFGAETTAIEYYPAQSRLVNAHNIYWLWVLPETVLPVWAQ